MHPTENKFKQFIFIHLYLLFSTVFVCRNELHIMAIHIFIRLIGHATDGVRNPPIAVTLLFNVCVVFLCTK